MPLHVPRYFPVLLAGLAIWCCAPLGADDAAEPGAGERIYRQRCAACHGEAGEGVTGGHAEPLEGDKSVEQLARYISRSMPEDAPGTCVGQDAENVARYIHGAFYSAIARARKEAPRIELSRLTVRQYQNAVLDLVDSFRDRPGANGSTRATAQTGLRAQYCDSGRPGRDVVLERIDPEVRFDFGKSPLALEKSETAEKLRLQGFTSRWEGALHAPDTGSYELIIRSDQAVRLWLNDLNHALIDAWVKSGNDTEYRASLFLIGGRAYPLRLELTSRQQGVEDKKKQPTKPVEAFVELCWKVPGLAAEVIPSRHLSPDRVPELFVLVTPFPPDDRSRGYERGSSIPRAWDEAATAAAIETAGHVTAHLEELAGAGAKAADRSARARAFCERFVERAFRRPLTVTERGRYIESQLERAPDVESGVRRVILLALKSPRFLYLDLQGDRPDVYSVASRLAFALWDSLPDQALLEAAASGQLLSRKSLEMQAARMLLDPRARSKMRQFLHQWLQIDPPPELAKDSKRFPEFNKLLASDLRASLDLFLDDVVWGESSDFRRLLLSSHLYLNGRAGRYYGFDLSEDAPFQKVNADPSQRAGILSHPYLLARFSYAETSSPIHRGVFLIRSLLGRTLRPPPEAFTPLPADLHPGLTTRERVALQTQPKPCQPCHSLINPLGFSFERFDAAGRWRDEENGKPIDASGLYAPLSGGAQPFEGVRELAELLARSEETQRAFAVKLFHYLVKQPILAHGKSAPESLQRAFVASGFNIQRLMVEIAVMSALARVDDFEGYPLPVPPRFRPRRF